MNSKPHQEQIKPGYFFSPGFYMHYWKNVIMSSFSPKDVAFNGKLKQHREVWIGAHLAALKTKLSGVNFFVALPHDDPPDVLIGAFEETKLPSGRTGSRLDWFPIEITRCDEASGETLFGQIQKKNKQAYENMILVIYLQGANKIPDLADLSKSLNALQIFYPTEVIVIAELNAKANKVPLGTFAFAQIYPKYDSYVVRRDDINAYFTKPNVMRVTGRGVQSTPVRVADIEWMPPAIS